MKLFKKRVLWIVVFLPKIEPDEATNIGNRVQGLDKNHIENKICKLPKIPVLKTSKILQIKKGQLVLYKKRTF